VIRRKEDIAKQQSARGDLLDQIPAAVWSTDERLDITTAGGALLEVFGLDSDELIGRGVGDFFRRFGIELVASSASRRAMAGESMRFELESNRRTYEARVEPAQRDGRVTGTIGIMVDVTENRHIQEQLRAVQRMESIGRLAGRLAHDFNNVLSVIESYGALLANDLPDARAREDVEVIRRAARKAADLVTQLLAFSRRQARQPEVLDLNEIVLELDRVLQRTIGEEVRLVTRLEKHLGSVVADRGQVEQVIMNLVTNACDAMPDGGLLTIETENAFLDELYCARHVAGSPGPYVVLSICDQGIGMDREVQSRIFEPFFTTKSKGKGTGLGLATVYGIVKQSSGFIWVYSEPGQGTCFKVYLPRVDEAPAPREPEPPVSSIAGTETILLVEDDDALRSATRRILRGRGYTILEARHGGEAVLLCERYGGTIHLLLTDVVMPQMSGRELWENLHQMRPEMKVVFMSGFADGAATEGGLVDQNAVFLSKPFNPQALLDCIRRAIDHG